MANKALKRIVFLKKFLNFMEDDDYIVLIQDEAGFGTKPLRRYAYSKIGEPAILKIKYLSHNLTSIATISTNGIELI